MSVRGKVNEDVEGGGRREEENSNESTFGGFCLTNVNTIGDKNEVS